MRHGQYVPGDTETAKPKGYPAYQPDGGRHLDDTETQPPYNANIGPGGPDMNRVGFPMVKTATKQKMSPFMATDQQGTPPPSSGVVPVNVPPAFGTNIPENRNQQITTASDISGFRSGSFRR